MLFRSGFRPCLGSRRTMCSLHFPSLGQYSFATSQPRTSLGGANRSTINVSLLVAHRKLLVLAIQEGSRQHLGSVQPFALRVPSGADVCAHALGISIEIPMVLVKG